MRATCPSGFSGTNAGYPVLGAKKADPSKRPRSFPGLQPQACRVYTHAPNPTRTMKKNTRTSPKTAPASKSIAKDLPPKKDPKGGLTSIDSATTLLTSMSQQRHDLAMRAIQNMRA